MRDEEKSVYQPPESDGTGLPEQQQPVHSDWRDSPVPTGYQGEIQQHRPDQRGTYDLSPLAGYGRTARGHLVSATQNRAGGSGYAAYQSHNHEIDNDYTDSVITTDTLKLGMKAAIMPMLVNGKIQQYVILDEMPGLDGYVDPL